jgi:TonB family protein
MRSPEIVLRVAIVMLSARAMQANAQISDSAARVRGAQMSLCPEVVRRDDGPMEGKSLSVSPFFLFSGPSQVGFGLTVGTPLNGVMGSLAVMNAMSMTDGTPRYSTNHVLAITINDSTRLTPPTAYEDHSPREGVHFENIGARVPVADVERFAGARRVRVQIGRDSFELNRGQVQALNALAREIQHPTESARIATGCVGPSPDELMTGWSSTGRNPNTSGVPKVKGPVYFEFQVEKPAAPTGNAHPIYPAVLHAAKVEASVVAQFVVLEDGSVDMDTFKIVRSTQDLFAASARQFVMRARFTPAEIGGKKVRELVQLPIEFRLGAGEGTRTDTAASGPILLRRQGSSEIISVPRDLPKWTTIEITPSDSAHLPADVFLPSQVDVPVRSPNGSAIPTAVPPELAAMFSGYAVLEFVANADGTVDASTFKVLRATSREIADIYSHGPMGMYVLPAELHGKKVRQLVVMATPVMMKHRQ